MEIIMDKRKSFTLVEVAAILNALTGLLKVAHDCGWL
jgi:hypothetical protein